VATLSIPATLAAPAAGAAASSFHEKALEQGIGRTVYLPVTEVLGSGVLEHHPDHVPTSPASPKMVTPP